MTPLNEPPKVFKNKYRNVIHCDVILFFSMIVLLRKINSTLFLEKAEKRQRQEKEKIKKKAWRTLIISMES